jgi:hypothetical protein
MKEWKLIAFCAVSFVAFFWYVIRPMPEIMLYGAMITSAQIEAGK